MTINNHIFRGFLKQLILITLGVLAATIGLKSFIIPNHFIDGGVMGISLLLSTILDYPLSIFVVLINLPFMFVGWQEVNWRFALKTLYAVTLLSVSLYYLHPAEVTQDKLLTALFGGFFLGSGIGLAIRGGAVIDGTEVLAIYLSRRTSATIGDFIFIINIVIFSVGALVLGVEVAMYSILTYLAASKMVDFIVQGIDEHVGVNIISSHSEAIRVVLTQKLGRGVTLYKGAGGYAMEGSEPREYNIVFCIITRLEIARTKAIIHEIDRNAFIYTYSINETMGGMLKQKSLH